MSLKPPKKSDLDKSWMKARRDSRKKIQPEYHLIVTEGTETEPAYFGAMKDIINKTYSDRIQIGVHGAGDNTLSLFQKAKNMATASANGYKHVWVVYDTDDFPADHINKTAKLTEMLNTLGYGDYEKNRADMYQILLPFMDAAIANAEKLNRINEGKPPSDSAPGTKVYELVKKLKPYLS